MARAVTLGPTPPFDDTSSRDLNRITAIYSTNLSTRDPVLAEGKGVVDHLYLGRLSRFYTRAQEQLPHVLTTQSLDANQLSFSRFVGSIHAARVWVFDVPASCLMLALTVDVPGELLALIPLLEDQYYTEYRIGEQSLLDFVLDRLAEQGVPVCSYRANPPALDGLTHQLVFASSNQGTATEDSDLVQRLVYRADLPLREGQSEILYPHELNRRSTTRGAVGPFVSVLSGLQDYMENAALISCIQLVASTGKAQAIRQATYDLLTSLQGIADFTHGGGQADAHRRADLSRMLSTVSNLEIQLTFAVEANRSILLLVPSLRVDSYHRALSSALDLESQSETITAMIARVQRAITAAAAGFEQLESQRGTYRRTRNALAVGVITTIAIPITLLFTYFSGNFTEVGTRHSIFDVTANLFIYALVCGLILSALGAYALATAITRSHLRGILKSIQEMNDGGVDEILDLSARSKTRVRSQPELGSGPEADPGRE